MERSSSSTSSTSSNGRKPKPAPLKVGKDSRVIRKPPVPLPMVQYRQPVIIHTYSPKVIETDATNFMWLVQRLTGSSDTRSRCKNTKPAAPVPSCMPASPTKSFNEIHLHHYHQDCSLQQQQQQQYQKPCKTEVQEEEISSGSELTAAEEEEQQQFKVEQLLLSPTSSSDSGFCTGTHMGRIACGAVLASPKSPLVSFDASGGLNFHFGDHQSGIFSTSGVSNINSSDSSVYVPQQQQQQQLPWSPLPTPQHTDMILSDFPSLDLWSAPASSSEMAVTNSAETTPIGLSPHSRLFGPLGALPSPATMAFRDMAFAFIKDSSN